MTTTRATQEKLILQQIPMFIKNKFGAHAANAFTEFVEEEEFDELDLIVEDFRDNAWDTEDCQIVTAVADSCQFTDLQKQAFWKQLRYFLGIDKQNPSSTTPNNNNNNNNGGGGHHVITKPSKMIRPSDVNWGKLSFKDVNRAKEVLNTQCFGKLGVNSNEALMRIFAYGLRSEVNLLPLLYDVYTHYRISSKMSSRLSATHAFNGAEVDTVKFCSHSEFLSNMKHMQYSPYNDIIQSISSFEARLMPRFNINRMQLIQDDCNDYIEYALMVGQVLNEMLLQNAALFPIQVDLLIVPKACSTGSAMTGMIESDGGSDYTSDSDDPYAGSQQHTTNKHKKQTAHAQQPAHNDENDIQSITVLLEERGIAFQSSTAISAQKFNSSKKILRSFVSTVLQNESHRRLIIVIDRRFAQNELIVYRLADEWSRIPEPVFVENFIFAAANFVLPQARESLKQTNPWVGGKQDSNGDSIYMFLLSFECLRADGIRLQWFWAGSGVRFNPALMAQLWPHSFEDQTVHKKYRQPAYLQTHFGLSCKDPTFDEWNRILSPNANNNNHNNNNHGY